MDPNVQQPVQSAQPVVSQPPTISEPPIVSKHFHFPRVLLVLLVALIAAVISAYIFYMVGKAQGQLTINTTSTKLSNMPKDAPQPNKADSLTTTQAQIVNWKIYTDVNNGFS